MDTQAFLIGFTVTKNKLLQEVRNETRRAVLCRVGGIMRAEFSAAGQQGLKPECVLTVASVDYMGETEAELGGVRYSVYRTYPVSEDYTELYLKRKYE